MTARIHLIKLCFLCHLLSSEHDTLASRTFHALASQDIYSLSIVQQCIFLDSKLGTTATASILSYTDHPKVHLGKAIKAILDQDKTQAPACHSTPISQTRLEHQLAPYLGDCPRYRSILDQNHSPFVWRTLLSKVFHHNTKWDVLLWTSGRIPLPLMYPWEFEQTIIWTESELTFQSFHLKKIIVSCHCSIS